MKDDILIWPRLTQLATCLCQEITDSGLPAPCFCGVMPGSATVIDYVTSCADGGMAWVRVVNAYAYGTFPEPLRTPARCASPLAFTAEVGIVRPFLPPDDGEPPDAALQLAATEQQLAEMAAIRRAILCCYGDDVVLGLYTPEGPANAVIGGAWNVTVPCD